MIIFIYIKENYALSEADLWPLKIMIYKITGSTSGARPSTLAARRGFLTTKMACNLGSSPIAGLGRAGIFCSGCGRTWTACGAAWSIELMSMTAADNLRVNLLGFLDDVAGILIVINANAYDIINFNMIRVFDCSSLLCL